jgi:hypothetical protein
MRRKSLLAIAVILLLAVGVAVMSAGSTAAPSSFRLRGWARPSASNAAAAAEAAAKDARRLVLILREVDFREFDLPPVGQVNPGDTFLFTDDAFTPAGRRVGYDQVRLTVMFREEVFVEEPWSSKAGDRSSSRASSASPSSGRPSLWLVGLASSATPAGRCSFCLGRPRRRPRLSSPCCSSLEQRRCPCGVISGTAARHLD